MHWTQNPKNRDKLLKLRRKASKTRAAKAVHKAVKHNGSVVSFERRHLREVIGNLRSKREKLTAAIDVLKELL